MVFYRRAQGVSAVCRKSELRHRLSESWYLTRLTDRKVKLVSAGAADTPAVPVCAQTSGFTCFYPRLRLLGLSRSNVGIRERRVGPGERRGVQACPFAHPVNPLGLYFDPWLAANATTRTTKSSTAARQSAEEGPRILRLWLGPSAVGPQPLTISGKMR